MQLLTIVIALGFLQVWGANNPLHKDQWFRSLVGRLEQSSLGKKFPHSLSLFAVLSVVIILGLAIYLLTHPSSWLSGISLPISVILLLYSLGRGEFSEIVSEYTKACYIEDWASAIERASPLGVITDDLNENDWSALHERVLDEAGYRGFERMFAVLFWFVLLGPLAAIAYRLVFLFTQEKPSDSLSSRILWAIEWPAVRLLGLSFSFTGNFVGCYNRLRESLFCGKSSTRVVLSRMLLGALSVEDDLTQTCEVTRKELNLVNRLYARTLWFWLGALAVMSVLS